MAGYVNIADELVEEVTEIIMNMHGYEGDEIDECLPSVRKRAEVVVSKHGIFATQYFIEVYNSVV